MKLTKLYLQNFDNANAAIRLLTKKVVLLSALIIASSLTACGGGGERSPSADAGTKEAFDPLKNVIMTLAWNGSSDQVDGYYIYQGPTETTADLQITDTADLPDFNMSAPTIKYDTVNDLGTKSGEQVCFRVKSYNQSGSSGYSKAVCTIL